MIIGDDVKLHQDIRPGGRHIFEQVIECFLAIDEKPALVETENGHVGQCYQGGIGFRYGFSYQIFVLRIHLQGIAEMMNGGIPPVALTDIALKLVAAENCVQRTFITACTAARIPKISTSRTAMGKISIKVSIRLRGSAANRSCFQV